MQEDDTRQEDGKDAKGSMFSVAPMFLSNFVSNIKPPQIGSPTQLISNVQSQFNTTFSTIFKEFDSQNADFIDSKRKANEPSLERTPGEGLPPWHLVGDGSSHVEFDAEDGRTQLQDVLKEQILALSNDRRNVTVEPPSDSDFIFDLNSAYSSAMATLKHDDRLEKLRFELVPKQISELNFWKNYFYRVSLVKRSVMLEYSGSEPKENPAKPIEPPEEGTTLEEIRSRSDSDWIKSIEGDLEIPEVSDPNWETELQRELGL